MNLGNKPAPKHGAASKKKLIERAQADSSNGLDSIPGFDDAAETRVVQPMAALADDTEDKKDDKNRKQTDGKKLAAKIAGGVVGVLAVAYLGGAAFFSSHFMPNTTLCGQNVSMRSVDDVAATLDESIVGYQATVKGDGVDLVIKGSDIDLQMDARTFVTDSKSAENAWAWPVEAWGTHEIQGAPDATVNEDKLIACLADAINTVNAQGTKPEDAKVAYDSSKKQFAVVPEVYGTTIDDKAMLAFVDKGIRSLEESIVPDETCLLQPAKKSDDETLAKAVENANKLLAGDIELTFNGTKAATVGNDQIAGWVKIADDASAALNEEAVTAWTKGDLSNELDTIGTQRTYTRPDGAQITVSGGSYGWSIDGATLAKTICDQVKAGSNAGIEIPALQQAQAWTTKGGQDWGDTYIDLSLGEQHARFYKGGKLVWESDVVSGDTSNGHPTPTGVYAVNGYKGLDQTLIGLDENGDGEPDYKSHVNYWIPFIDNLVAFHDADWRGSFGGTIYQWNGSHGCVNLPASKAAELYDICDVGTVVVVHD